MIRGQPFYMKKTTNPVLDHFKLLLFILLLCELVIFFAALLFGKVLGYALTLTACFWLGTVIAACFFFIVLGNLGQILIHKILERLKGKRIQID